jgi:single-strand DNA-binding protein
MLNYSKVMLSGRLTATPELKSTTSGKSVCSFDVAYNPNKDTAYFFTCVAWEAKAEFVAKEVKKGAPIFVEGELVQRKFQDNKGNNRSVVEIRVTEVKFVESLEEKNARLAAETPVVTTTTAEEPSTEIFEEIGVDDLPF